MNRDTGNMIKAARKRAGLTQGELGERIGVTASAICQMETGDRAYDFSPKTIRRIADALYDMQLLHNYCLTCDLRSRISIRKFTPLNNIVPGAIGAAVKNVQKMSEAMEMLSQLLPKMLSPGFESCPDFIDFRNTTVMKAIDVRRGLEILFDQLIREKILTEGDLKMLEDVQQRMCEEKGYHKPLVEG